MNLEELLALERPPEDLQVSSGDLKKWFWQHRGMLKSQERNEAFWNATNMNLKTAYEKLDQKDRQLAVAYRIIQEDLAVAQQVQHALLPSAPQALLDQLEIGVFHEQLNEVGGDYYDYFVVDGDGDGADPRLAIGVFDISGHGVSAALVMTYLKAVFMRALPLSESPKAAVEHVNSTCLSFLKDVKKYATVNFVEVLEDTVQYVCGGGFGLILRKDGSSHTFSRKDHFLGLRDRPFRQFTVDFGPADVMVLYTDGMVEAQDDNGSDYSVRRLNDLVLANVDRPVDEIVATCVEDYQQFRKQDVDDITLLVLRRKAN